MMVLLQFDGMLHQPDDQPGNKAGLLGYGWLITNRKHEMAHGFGVFAHPCQANSNIAEYLALIEGLEALADLRIWQTQIEIRGDAKCVIDQMRGSAAVSSPVTHRLFERARRLANRFPNLTWIWVPRKKNKLADQLSRRGLRQLYNTPDAYEKAISQLHQAPRHRDRLIPVVDLRVYAPSEI